MKKLTFLFLISGWALTTQGQNLMEEMFYPDTLKSSRDSFYVNSPKFERIWRFPITKKDTLNLGTSGYEGVYMTIWTDTDTLTIPHVNYPNQQLIKIPIASPRDTALCILRFQPNTSDFTAEYQAARQAKVSFEIPEVYELANVALFLSNCATQTGNAPATPYAQRVKEHFAPYSQHPLIRWLNARCTGNALWDMYYGFRENSVCFAFDRTYLKYATPYKQVYWDGSDLLGGHFRNVLYLVQDFAEKSKFRQFYAANQAYYQKLLARQEQLLAVKPMWDWLEREFPQRMDAYKIVFSPLIGGSHSTQKFQQGFFLEPEFEECVMFINSPETIDQHLEYAEAYKAGLMAGIVFTEIDHNYVNPASDQHQEAIQSLIRDKNAWASPTAQSYYGSTAAIFNEYMTHALFCLYVKESKTPVDLQNQIIARRIELMNRRGFTKFAAFNQKLLQLLLDRKQTVFAAYGSIILAMEELN